MSAIFIRSEAETYPGAAGNGGRGKGSATVQQFEFYNFITNSSELGNNYVNDGANASNYGAALTSIASNTSSYNELYYIDPSVLAAYNNAFCNYWNFVQANPADSMQFLL